MIRISQKRTKRRSLERTVYNATSSTYIASEDGRVVKASDSKSDGATRAGSNPVPRETFDYFLRIFHFISPQSVFSFRSKL